MASQAERLTMLRHARQALDAGDHRAARSLLHYLLERNPQDRQARAMLEILQPRPERAATRPSIAGKAQPDQAERVSQWGFRSLSVIGACALLLLLVVALLLPDGAILAIRDSAAVSRVPQAAAGQLSAVPAAASLLGGGLVMPTGSVLVEPPVVGQGGTCISGLIIDKYHQVAGEGWPVTITSESGAEISLTADAAGAFKFEDLYAGVWTVALQVPDGWQPFTLGTFQVTLSGSGDNCAEVRFKVEALPCLEVDKLDAGGQAGFSDKVGIPDWEMVATREDITLTARTDGTGRAYFYNLEPGTWTVTEESKSGWQPTTPYSTVQELALASPRQPGICQTLTFVNEQVHDGCIEVRKVDAVGNPLPDWTITVVRDDGTQPFLSGQTDSLGYAVFDGLALGAWTVMEEMQDWWRPLGDVEQSVLLVEPGRCESVTFTNESLGCVDGYKINHLGNGLAGWDVTARNDFTGEVFTATTDTDGYFQFTGLTLGTWLISETLQAGWEAVTAPSFLIEVREPFVCEHVRFKNKTNFACVDVFKKDYTDGAGLPGWDITIQPAYGGISLTGQTDGTGWVRFNGLTPGTYVVAETVQTGWLPVGATQVEVTLTAAGTCDVVTFQNRQETAPPPPDPPPDPPSRNGCRTHYRVRAGDTLNSIARRYNSTVAALAKANHLRNVNLIYVGQRLCVP